MVRVRFRVPFPRKEADARAMLLAIRFSDGESDDENGLYDI